MNTKNDRLADAVANTFVFAIIFSTGMLGGLAIRPDVLLTESTTAAFYVGLAASAAFGIPAIWLARGRPRVREMWYSEGEAE